MRFIAMLLLFLSFCATELNAQPGPLPDISHIIPKPPKNKIKDFKPYDVIFCFDTVLNPTIKVKMLNLKEVSIVDVAKGEIVQTIIPRQNHEFYMGHFNEHIQLFDTARNSHQLAAFRFMVQEQYYTDRKYDALKWDHYVFDHKQKRYVLDHALSDYFNVRIDTANDTLWRYYVTEQPPYKITTFFALENGAWVESYSDQTLINYPPPPKEENHCMRLDNGNFHVLPVVFENENRMFITRDSFMFWNYCEKNVGIDLAQTSDKYAPNFKIVHTGKKSLQINFEQIVAAQHLEGIGQTTGNFYLKFLGEPIGFTLALKGFRVRNEAKSFVDENGKIAYFYHDNADGLTTQILLVDSLIRPTGFGESLTLTGERMGLWNFFDHENNTESYQQFGKLLHIRRAQKPLVEDGLKVYSYENGKWKESPFAFKQNMLSMPFREYTDSIKLVLNDETCTFKVNFAQWQNGTHLEAYFVRPGDLYYVYNFGMRVPIYLKKNDYTIQWQPDSIEEKTYEACAKAIANLFPQLSFSKHPNLVQATSFSFPETMSQAQRDEILDKMLTLPYVWSIAQGIENEHYSQPIGLPSANISVEYNTTLKEIVPWFEAHNFNVTRNNPGFQDQFFYLEYHKRLFDERLIRDLMALARHPKVTQALPDMMYKVEFEPVNQIDLNIDIAPIKWIEKK